MAPEAAGGVADGARGGRPLLHGPRLRARASLGGRVPPRSGAFCVLPFYPATLLRFIWNFRKIINKQQAVKKVIGQHIPELGFPHIIHHYYRTFFKTAAGHLATISDLHFEETMYPLAIGVRCDPSRTVIFETERRPLGLQLVTLAGVPLTNFS